MIAGRYTLDREIGRGGMGAVWLGRDEVLGRAGRAQAHRLRPRRRAPPTSTAPSARPGSPPGSTTPTSSPSTTWSRRATTTGWSWSTSPGSTLAELVRATARSTPTRPRRCCAQAADAPGRRARRRDRAPRREAVEHPGHARRAGEALRLRHRPRAGRRVADPDRPGDRVAGVPRARGRLRAAGHRRERRLVARAPRCSTRSPGRPPYDVGDNLLGALYRIVHEEPPRLGATAGWLAPVLLGDDGPASPGPLVDGPRPRLPRRRPVGPAAGRRSRARPGRGAAEPDPTAHPGADRPASPPVAAAPPRAPGPRRRRRSPRCPCSSLVARRRLAGRRRRGRLDPRLRRRPGVRADGAVAQPVELDVVAPGDTRRVTADGMENFIEDYLATVTSRPEGRVGELTPAFQEESGELRAVQEVLERRPDRRHDRRPRPTRDHDRSATPSSTSTRTARRPRDDVTLQLEGTRRQLPDRRRELTPAPYRWAQEGSMELAALYRDIVERSPDAFWVCDLDGRTIYANPAMCELYGADADEMARRHRLRLARRARPRAVRRAPRGAQARSAATATTSTSSSGAATVRRCG